MNMEDNKYKDLEKSWLEFKAAHKKSIDTSAYDTFNLVVLPVVKKYCRENENVSYQCDITEEGASVILKSHIFLFDEKDADILRILPLADLVEIQSFDDVVTITIWVRSWNWRLSEDKIK